MQPESIYAPHLMPPSSYLENSSNAVTTRFVKTATNKMRCPIFTLAWTPEGRRLVTGASSGEFTLWNGLTFNFETILQVCVYFICVFCEFEKQLKVKMFFRRMMYLLEQWSGHTTISGWLLAITMDTLSTGNQI